jgi:large subunit ribosomal protein L29
MKLAEFKKEIKGLSTQELQEKLAAEKETLIRMKLNHSVSPMSDPSQLKAIRKNIARMNTELSLRENK